MDHSRESGTDALALVQSDTMSASLSFSFMKLDDRTAKLVAVHLPKHTNLTTLDFSLNAIGDSGTKAIAASLPSSLANLRLSHNRIADSGARALAVALAQSQVTALDLRQNSIGDAGACELLPLLVDSSLRQMALAGNQLGDEAAAVVAELLALGVSNISHVADGAPNVNRIDLSDNRIGAVGVGCIAEALVSSPVESVSLAGNPLGDAGLLELAQHLSSMSNLRSLDIGRTVDGQQSDGLLSVFNVLAGDQLDAEGKVVAPDSERSMDPFSLTQRSAVSGFPSITSFSLSGTSMMASSSMYEALARSLRFNPVVQSLDLSSCQLNKFAIRTLVDALIDNHCLHSLNLSHNPLEDISARVLWSSLSRNQTLKHVALADCMLSAPSIAGLVEALQRGCLLESVDLSSNQITPADVVSLSAVVRGTRVIELDVGFVDSDQSIGVNDEWTTAALELRDQLFRNRMQRDLTDQTPASTNRRSSIVEVQALIEVAKLSDSHVEAPAEPLSDAPVPAAEPIAAPIEATQDHVDVGVTAKSAPTTLDAPPLAAVPIDSIPSSTSPDATLPPPASDLPISNRNFSDVVVALTPETVPEALPTLIGAGLFDSDQQLEEAEAAALKLLSASSAPADSNSDALVTRLLNEIRFWKSDHTRLTRALTAAHAEAQRHRESQFEAERQFSIAHTDATSKAAEIENLKRERSLERATLAEHDAARRAALAARDESDGAAEAARVRLVAAEESARASDQMLATRESELAAANAEIGKQKASLINAESVITQHVATIADANRLIEQLKSERAEWDQRCLAAESATLTAVSCQQVAERGHEAAEARSQQAEQLLNETRAASESLSSQIQQQLASLTEQHLQQLQQSHDSVQSAESQMRSAVSALESEKAMHALTKAKAAEALSETQHASERVTQLSEQISALQSTLSLCRAELAQAQQNIASSQAECTAAMNQRSEAVKALDVQKRALEQSERDVANMKLQHSQIDRQTSQRIAALETELGRERAKAAEAAQLALVKLAESETEARVAAQQADELRSQCTMLRSELQTLTDLLSNERRRMNESELQLRDALSKESQSVINLRSELDQQSSVNIELRHSLSAAESFCESKLHQLTQCEASLVSTQHELEALRSEIRNENLEKFRDSQQLKSMCQELESCKRHLADAQQDIGFIRSENVELRKQIATPTIVATASVVSVSLAPSEVDKQLAAIRVELAGERTSRMQAERALALLQGSQGVSPVQSESAPQQQTVNAPSKNSTDVNVEELYSRLQHAEASLVTLFQQNTSLQQQQHSATESSAKRIEQLQSLLAGRNQDCVSAQNVASELRTRLDAVARAAELAHRDAESQAALLRQNASKLEGDLQAVRARLVKALDDLQRSEVNTRESAASAQRSHQSALNDALQRAQSAADSRYAELQQQLVSAKQVSDETHHSLQSALQASRDRMVQLESELSQSQSTYRESQSLLNATQSKLDQSQTDLQKCKAQFEASLSAVHANLADLNDQLRSEREAHAYSRAASNSQSNAAAQAELKLSDSLWQQTKRAETAEATLRRTELMLQAVKSSYRVEIDALQRSLASAVAEVEPNKTARDQLDKELAREKVESRTLRHQLTAAEKQLKIAQSDAAQYRQTSHSLQLQLVSLRQQLVVAPSEPLSSLVNDTAERQSKQMSLLQQRRAEKEAERCREAVAAAERRVAELEAELIEVASQRTEATNLLTARASGFCVSCESLKSQLQRTKQTAADEMRILNDRIAAAEGRATTAEHKSISMIDFRSLFSAAKRRQQELITQHRAQLASSLKAEQDRTAAAQKCCDELTAQVQLLSAQLSDSLALDAEHVARLAAARAQFDAEIAFMRSQVSVVCEALPAMDEELNAYKGSGDGAIALMARHNSALKQQVMSQTELLVTMRTELIALAATFQETTDLLKATRMEADLAKKDASLSKESERAAILHREQSDQIAAAAVVRLAAVRSESAAAAALAQSQIDKLQTALNISVEQTANETQLKSLRAFVAIAASELSALRTQHERGAEAAHLVSQENAVLVADLTAQLEHLQHSASLFDQRESKMSEQVQQTIDQLKLATDARDAALHRAEASDAKALEAARALEHNQRELKEMSNLLFLRTTDNARLRQALGDIDLNESNEVGSTLATVDAEMARLRALSAKWQLQCEQAEQRLATFDERMAQATADLTKQREVAFQQRDQQVVALVELQRKLDDTHKQHAALVAHKDARMQALLTDMQTARTQWLALKAQNDFHDPRFVEQKVSQELNLIRKLQTQNDELSQYASSCDADFAALHSVIGALNELPEFTAAWQRLKADSTSKVVERIKSVRKLQAYYSQCRVM